MNPSTPAPAVASATPARHASRARSALSPIGVLAELSAGPCSGSELAARLGVTRAAVWKQVERLRGLGVGIAAQAGGGYRLESPLELLDATRITTALGPAIRAHLGDLAVHWQLDSTSSELLRRAAADPRDALACVAEVQSAGRGRRGRAWRMPLGGGLALSLLKRFDGGMAALAGLSLVAGLAAVQALADCGIGEVGLKWPNDLVARERKLGGVLIEIGGEAMGPCHAVVGVGLNVRLDARGGAAIDQPWIDLAALTGDTPPSRNLLAARLLERLVEALARFAEAGFAVFADDFACMDALAGRRVRVLCGARIEEGIARGVDARGALRVECADGEHAIDSGEVSIRMAP